ncbi:MAG: hypothetical protein LUG86_02120 [Oscillospiraceae bacterium]|nr:hypothetical protein [Oscillospiraceae bacterium]
MELNDLKEYLGMVVDLEKNIYLQNELISEIEKKAESLGVEKIYTKPDLKESSAGVYGLFTVIGVVFSCLTIYGGILVMDVSLLAFLPGLFLLCCGGMGLFISVFLGIPSVFKAKKEYKEETRRFPHRLEDYERNIAEDKTRVNKELQEKAVLSHELDILRKTNDKSKQILDMLYSCGNIVPKYRNFAMMCSIYGYINSGRCTILDGYDGAYNILETEIRMDCIIVQLDKIRYNLTQIQSSQYIIYNAIQENYYVREQILESIDQSITYLCNDSIKSDDEFKAALGSVDENSALSAYAVERLQKEAKYMYAMDYFGKKYGTYFDPQPQ